MKQIAPMLYVSNVASFGDANLLAANGIQLAIGSHGHANFPHGGSLESAEFHIRSDGSNSDLFIKAIARLLSHAYGAVVLCLTDSSGGLTEASFLIACAYAEKLNTTFDAGLAWLKNAGRLPDAAPPQALIDQGRRVWP